MFILEKKGWQIMSSVIYLSRWGSVVGENKINFFKKEIINKTKSVP